jgi:hypothetical protein
MSSYNSKDNHEQEKNHLGYNDSDLFSKIEQIKANKESRLQGKSPRELARIQNQAAKRLNKVGPLKPIKSVLGGSKDVNNNSAGPIMSIEQAVSLSANEDNNKKEEFNNPSTFVKSESESSTTATEGSGSGNDYSFYQSQIQSKFAQFQGERINEIAKLARKDRHEILLFKDQNISTNPDQIPEDDNAITDLNMSQENYINSVCDRQVFRIKQVPNSVHVRLDELRAEIADLQRVKSLATSSVSDKGIVIPPQLVRNDFSVTGISDQEFSSISEIIQEKSEQLYKLMAFYYFGIGKKTYARVETTSFTSAVEAGQYREQFGLVESSKNSTSYLT